MRSGQINRLSFHWADWIAVAGRMDEMPLSVKWAAREYYGAGGSSM